MANIRIDLDYAIKDGAKIVFRSPCDCTEITGLIVYYIEDGVQTSKEFTLADAHGQNVGDIPHLFASDVVVKVILDVTSGMAFVQNADTNTYIEKTFVKTVNGTAPDKNGNVEVPGGASSWNDLTDKPFYEKGGEVEVFPEQTLTSTASAGVWQLDIIPAPFVLVEGETYRVVIDGTKHEMVCELSEGALCISKVVQDEITGEPESGSFVVAYVTPEVTGMDDAVVQVMVIDSTNAETHTLAIYHDGTTIKTLDAKFLPMDAIDARIEEYISAALEGEY